MAITVDGKTYTLPDQIGLIIALPSGPYMLAMRMVNASPADKKWASLIEKQRQDLKGPGGIKAAPARDRAIVWTAIEHVLTPFGSQYGAEDSKQFGYWFNYFWNEAREAYDLNDAGKAQLCDAFFAALQSGANGYEPSDSFKNLDYTQMQTILLKIMRVGFKRVQINEGAKSRAPIAVDAKTLFAIQVSLKTEKNVRTLSIGFRGDNRPPEALAKSGFMARARSLGQTVHQQYGLDQPWHPFNLDIYRDSMFVRKGKSKDNCLHTVISVASGLRDIMPYPLVSDASLYNLASKDPSRWNDSDVTYTHSHWMNLKIVGLKREPTGSTVKISFDRITTDKNIYVLDMSKGKGFNTEAWQASLSVSNPFPERAIDGVLPEQILGAIKIRKHYFYYSGEVSLFDVELLSFDFIQSEDTVRGLLGDSAPADIRGLIEREIKLAQSDYRIAKGNYERSKMSAAVPATGPTAAGLKCTFQGCSKTFKNAMFLNMHLKQDHKIEA